nr:unnamed protein product [Callosobruchus chinensis]
MQSREGHFNSSVTRP